MRIQINSETVDRVVGVLLGLAVGDRNGGPTQMALRIAESLAECHRFDRQDIFKRYLQWHKEGAFDTGPVTEAVLALAAEGVVPSDAVAQVDAENHGLTAGCNPAHRISPLAAAAWLSDDELPVLAASEAALTHGNPLAGDVAAATTVVCRALIRGNAWPKALELAAEGRREETSRALSPQADDALSTGGFAPDTLQTAIHFLDVEASFESSLEQGIRFAGPANYCPVLIGAIGGARWGAAAIASHHLSHVIDLARLQHVAGQLAEGWIVG